jgi:ABC-type multidrug transport system ATPase subunit
MVRQRSRPRLDPDGTASAVMCADWTKDYGSGHGVFDLDLAVREGETFGFIGSNGADRGSATVLGLASRRDSVAVKRRVGYLPGELVPFPGVTAGYVIGLLAGVRGGVGPARITALAQRFDLDPGRRYETLSHGNKQKVGLIQAFMHRPDVVILDEPTLGVDPLMQREFRRLVQETAAGGATVFLSPHVLSEVEAVCDRIGLIRAGRLERVGSLNELRAVRVHRVEARFTGRLCAADVAHVPGSPSCASRTTCSPARYRAAWRRCWTCCPPRTPSSWTATRCRWMRCSSGAAGRPSRPLVADTVRAHRWGIVAVAILAVFVAASYLLVYLVPLFARPDWLNRTTIFGAYGNPYLERPTASGLALPAAIAAGGGLLAAALAQRSPKAAT